MVKFSLLWLQLSDIARLFFRNILRKDRRRPLLGDKFA